MSITAILVACLFTNAYCHLQHLRVKAAHHRKACLTFDIVDQSVAKSDHISVSSGGQPLDFDYLESATPGWNLHRSASGWQLLTSVSTGSNHTLCGTLKHGFRCSVNTIYTLHIGNHTVGSSSVSCQRSPVNQQKTKRVSIHAHAKRSGKFHKLGNDAVARCHEFSATELMRNDEDAVGAHGTAEGFYPFGRQGDDDRLAVPDDDFDPSGVIDFSGQEEPDCVTFSFDFGGVDPTSRTTLTKLSNLVLQLHVTHTHADHLTVHIQPPNTAESFTLNNLPPDSISTILVTAGASTGAHIDEQSHALVGSVNVQKLQNMYPFGVWTVTLTDLSEGDFGLVSPDDFWLDLEFDSTDALSDPCNPNPCEHHSKCMYTASAHGYQCSCSGTGFRGFHCSIKCPDFCLNCADDGSCTHCASGYVVAFGVCVPPNVGECGEYGPYYFQPATKSSDNVIKHWVRQFTPFGQRHLSHNVHSTYHNITGKALTQADDAPYNTEPKFTCDNNDEILESKTCDGNNDCEDGSDESPDLCSVCQVKYPEYLGNGRCDGFPYNTARCGYDGGDCCECSCTHGAYRCGHHGYDCKSPHPCGQPEDFANGFIDHGGVVEWQMPQLPQTSCCPHCSGPGAPVHTYCPWVGAHQFLCHTKKSAGGYKAHLFTSVSEMLHEQVYYSDTVSTMPQYQQYWIHSSDHGFAPGKCTV